jgi:hypothetical protein
VENTAPRGLVAAWDFDEGAGGVANDLTGNGHAGTLRNAGWSSSGKFGGALWFNGVDAWVTVDDAADLRLTNGMTVEAWVRPDGFDGFETVVLKERSGSLSYALYANDPDREPGLPAGWAITDGGSDSGAHGLESVPLNAWTHLATTYDGDSLRLYVNGELVWTEPLVGDIQNADSAALRIGGNSVWGEYFSGLIDEVRIYNRPLGADEILSDSRSPIGASGGAAPGASTFFQPVIYPANTFAGSSVIGTRAEHESTADLLRGGDSPLL